MKFIFEISSRAKLDISAEIKHEKLINFLKSVDAPWGIDKNLSIPFPGFGMEFTATVVLNKFIGNSIKMSIFYRYRNNLTDDTLSDDRIYIEFNPKKVDYNYLLTNIFPLFIEHFDAYFADIFDFPLIYKDYEEKRFGNRRHVINRVYPVSFYDEKLCNSFFKRKPKEIVRLLEGHVHSAKVFNNGVLIIEDTRPLSMDESENFEKKIKLLLKY